MNRKKITPLPPHRGGNPFHEEPAIWGAGGKTKQRKQKINKIESWKKLF